MQSLEERGRQKGLCFLGPPWDALCLSFPPDRGWSNSLVTRIVVNRQDPGPEFWLW